MYQVIKRVLKQREQWYLFHVKQWLLDYVYNNLPKNITETFKKNMVERSVILS